MLLLLLTLLAAAVCACTLLALVLRARDRHLLAAVARAAYSDAPDAIGISVLCSGVTDIPQIENLLSSEYSRYEVVVVLDSRRQSEEFAALAARYRMIRVEWIPTGELEVEGVRALGRSRKRCFRRLVLVDRVFDGAEGDFDAAAAVATYDYLLPVGEGQRLVPGAVERLVAELGSEPPGTIDLVRSRLGEPAVLLSRESLVAAGGFGMRPLREIPRARRRTLWEPLLTFPGAGNREPRGWRLAAALLLAAGFTAAVAAGWWAAAAVLVTVGLVWAAAAYASRTVAEMSPDTVRLFIPLRRIFRYY